MKLISLKKMKKLSIEIIVRSIKILIGLIYFEYLPV